MPHNNLAEARLCQKSSPPTDHQRAGSQVDFSCTAARATSWATHSLRTWRGRQSRTRTAPLHHWGGQQSVARTHPRGHHHPGKLLNPTQAVFCGRKREAPLRLVGYTPHIIARPALSSMPTGHAVTPVCLQLRGGLSAKKCCWSNHGNLEKMAAIGFTMVLSAARTGGVPPPAARGHQGKAAQRRRLHVTGLAKP